MSLSKTASFCVAAVILIVSGCARSPGPQDSSPDIRHVEPDDETGTSLATVVGDVALAHTAQAFAFDADGRLAGRTDVAAQFSQALENLNAALDLVGAGLPDLVRLNIYLAEDVQRSDLLPLLAQALPADSRPAVTFVTTEPAHPDVLVGMDAVAVAPPHENRRVERIRTDDLPGRKHQAHVAVLPPGSRLFISGQAARGELVEATSETMRGLLATLAYQGSSAADVVQVKAFANSMADADTIAATIETFFRDEVVPPIIITEWRQENIPVEIEVVAVGRRSSEDAAGPISYVTPPWMSAVPVFSRSVEVHSGDLVFVSGLYPTPGSDDEQQVEELFGLLDDALSKAGSDFEHLVKATYYHSSSTAGQALSAIRRNLYNPDRPPAASKIDVRSVSVEGATITMDMIGVVPR